MTKKYEVQHFLDHFFVKYRLFDILFLERTNPKNTQTLLSLEITPAKRRQIIESITADDYVEGPLKDTLYQLSDMWVFGKTLKEHPIYIKISSGRPGSNVLCISFHIAERPLRYPFKSIT